MFYRYRRVNGVYCTTEKTSCLRVLKTWLKDDENKLVAVEDERACIKHVCRLLPSASVREPEDGSENCVSLLVLRGSVGLDATSVRCPDACHRKDKRTAIYGNAVQNETSEKTCRNTSRRRRDP